MCKYGSHTVTFEWHVLLKTLVKFAQYKFMMMMIVIITIKLFYYHNDCYALQLEQQLILSTSCGSRVRVGKEDRRRKSAYKIKEEPGWNTGMQGVESCK